MIRERLEELDLRVRERAHLQAANSNRADWCAFAKHGDRQRAPKPCARDCGEQLEIATVFIREWRYLEGERRDEFVAERRRYEDRFRALFREGRELGELRTDLDDATATLLALSAANWAYTWLRPGADTDELADRFYAFLLDGMRGYATP